MKPRKPHKRSLKAVIRALLREYPGGLNAYELAYEIGKYYPSVVSSIPAVRKTLTELIGNGKVAKMGKQCCPTCYASQTFYKLKRNRLSIR